MKTKCESCGTEHEWDACQDYYPTCLEQDFRVSTTRTLTLIICPCKAVVAVHIVDDFGGTVYVPCLEDL